MNDFVKIMEYLQSRVFGYYNFKVKKEDLSKIESFLKKNNIDNIWEYLLFHFALKCSEHSRIRMIPTSHVISKTAYKRFANRTREQNFIITKFLMLRRLKNPIEKTNGHVLSERYLSNVRRNHFNTAKGLLECSSLNYMCYNEEECKDCQFNYICKTK